MVRVRRNGPAAPPGDPGRAPADLEVRVVGRPDGDVAIVSFGLGSESRMLTPAESDIIRALLRGESYASIARARDASIHTVRTQISSAYAKLGVSSRSELLSGRALLKAERSRP